MPQADSFGIHPALLDAALHTVGAAQRLVRGAGTIRFKRVGAPGPKISLALLLVSDVRLHAGGASRLRGEMHAEPDGSVSLALFDESGESFCRRLARWRFARSAWLSCAPYAGTPARLSIFSVLSGQRPPSASAGAQPLIEVVTLLGGQQARAAAALSATASSVDVLVDMTELREIAWIAMRRFLES